MSNRNALTQLLVDCRSVVRTYTGAALALAATGFALGLLVTAVF